MTKVLALFLLTLLFADDVMLAADGLKATGSRPPAIPIVIDAGNASAQETIPLGCGFPLKEGQALAISELAVEIPGQGMVPAQFEVRTRYESGSILWLWADFLAKPNGTARLVFGKKNPADEMPNITVMETPKDIVINNGTLEFAWDKQYASPVRVSSVNNESKQEIATGTGGDIYLIDQNDRKAIFGGNGGKLIWKVETSGKVRVVLRCEGYYTIPDGTQIARAVVRYHIYRDRPEIKLEHTFIITRDNDEIWYKEIGISLPLKKTDRYKAYFSDRKGTVYCEDLKSWENAWVFQKEYPVYNRKEYVCELGKGKDVKQQIGESAGWAALDNGTACVIIAMKDFAIQFPKEFRASDGRMTIKLWSGRDGRKLDYRPKTLCEDWWKEWVYFSNKPKDNNNKELQPDFIRSEENNPSCVGLSRNHELTFAYFPATIDVKKCQVIANDVKIPPLAYADPRWLCHVDPRAFWQMAAKGEGGKDFEDIEEFISTWFDEFMVPQEYFRYTGWYDWGNHPELRYFKQVNNNVINVYPVWYRLGQKNAYTVNKAIMLGWARSGDRKYLDVAQRYISWTAQYCFTRWSGGKRRRINGMLLPTPGERIQLPYWFYGPGDLHLDGELEFVNAMAMLYLLRDARWSKDTLEPLKDNLLTKFKCDNSFTGMGPDAFTAQMIGLYRVFPSPELKEKARVLFTAFTDPEGAGGMSKAWFSKNRVNYTDVYKSPRKSLAVMEYCDVFGYDDRNLKVLEKAAVKGYEQSFPEVCQYCDFWGATLAKAYQHNKNKDLQEKSKYQLETVRKLYAAYKKSEKQGGAYFIENLSTNPGHGGSGGTWYRFPELGLTYQSARDNNPNDEIKPGREDKDISLRFTTVTSGTPFISLPMEIWMLNDFKEPEWE